MQTEYVQVLTTLSTRQEGESLARHLVESRMAACVQVSGPVTSHYHWQGKLEREQEYQLQIKSRLDRYPELAAEIKKHHPYETPEILVLPIIAGSEEYLLWLDQELDRMP